MADACRGGWRWRLKMVVEVMLVMEMVEVVVDLST